MRYAPPIISALAGLLLAAPAAAETLVGLAAPLSGPSAILGQQMRAGAETAASLQGASDKIRLNIADDACTSAGGRKAARDFVAAKVRIVVGFLCTEAIEAALPILKDAKIPTIAVGVRTDSLTDRRARTGWPVYRLGPRADSERDAAGTILSSLWKSKLFAIVDDGTIHGRELSESVRIATEQEGLKPVFVDTFRPQLDNQIGLVGRLKRAGATDVFVGGDRDDIAIIGRDARQQQADVTIAGGEALRAPPGGISLAVGTLMIALPEWETQDAAIVQALAAKNVVAEGYVLPAYAAVQIAVEALSGLAPDAPVPSLSGRDFSTVLGPVRFDDKGDRTENPYRDFRFDGTSFVPLP